MGKNRLEAFSDGVLAIIITIMVLELKAPHGADLKSLSPLVHILLSYILSFIYIGIYWNNHHHLFHATSRVSAGILWANLHLLFWLSLFPFATAWIGENQLSSVPTAMYGGILLMAGVSYYLLQQTIIRHQGRNSLLATALGRDWKGLASMFIYVAAIPVAFLSPWLAIALYTTVAAIWLIPDRRIERALQQHEPS